MGFSCSILDMLQCDTFLVQELQTLHFSLNTHTLLSFFLFNENNFISFFKVTVRFYSIIEESRLKGISGGG